MKTKLLIGLFGLFLFSACSPTEYSVTREVEIDAPAELVFAQVNNHKMRDAWSPWESMDPNMTKSYEGPEEGVGAFYSWVGNDSVGTGTLEIMESVPNEMIKSKLTFTAPWESTSEVIWSFKENNGKTTASWTVEGELPGYLFWMGQEEMDENMGPDFMRGLNSLKEVAETKAAEMPSLPVSLVEVDAMPMYYIVGESKISEMSSEFFGSRFGALMTYLGSDAQNMLEMPMAIAQEWNEEENYAKIWVAIACKSDKKGAGQIQKGMTHDGKAVVCEYRGDYGGTEAGHHAASEYIEAEGLQIAGAPWEVYVTDPMTEPDTSKWLTKVYYPIASGDEM